jgi:ferric-dicitrate binding protein FerR (iron transport regulator)
MKPTESKGDAQLPVAERIAYLIAGFLRGSLTEAEHDELDAWVVASDENTRLFEELTDEANLEAALDWHRRLDREKALRNIKEATGLRSKNTIVRPFWPLLLAAATILVAVISIYLFSLKDAGTSEVGLAPSEAPGTVRPGRNQAVLTLSSGRTIILDSSGSGLLASEGGVRVNKRGGGELVYEGGGASLNYHSVSIPRGGQYKLVLSDGTRVWLNAESSLRFPASFTPGNREVELRGEGYFEVAKDAKSPFRVKSWTPSGGEQVVEVLGTVFNIQAYGDPSGTRTTLIEGSVRVVKGSESLVLRPGEQARGEKDFRVVKADLPREVAWKEGLFRFRDANIKEIGEEITRWYDVEVEYRGRIPYHFNATIERSEPLSRVLEALQATKRVRFTLEGKKLIIEP